MKTRNLGILFVAALLAQGCSNYGKPAVNALDNHADTLEYHADNDIAMTVRSIVDAMTVGEKIQPADYDFRGVLTDGTGAPLYVDATGAPGEWDVSVQGDSAVVLRNLYLGDIHPTGLIDYIADALGLQDDDILSFSEPVEGEGHSTYSTGVGRISFDYSPRETPSGKTGTMFVVMIGNSQI